MNTETVKEEPPADVGSGQISGGWEFIWSAYGITWIALIVYITFIWTRGKR